MISISESIFGNSLVTKLFKLPKTHSVHDTMANQKSEVAAKSNLRTMPKPKRDISKLGLKAPSWL